MNDAERLARENALAERMYPAEWSRMLATTGKRRSSLRARLRQRAVAETRMAELRAAGASCRTCRHFRKATFSEGGAGHVCGLRTDSDGYVRAKADGICPDFAPNPKEP